MAASSPTAAIQDLCRGLQLDDKILKEFSQCFAEDLKNSLDNKVKKASIECDLSIMERLPTGAERGQFLALEFSGVDVKVALVKLKDNSFDMRAKQYTISEDLKKGTGVKLFDFLAHSVQDFCQSHRIIDISLSMGFAFGFPYEQKSVKSGILVRWTKEFSVSGVVGKDVVALLEKAMAKENMKVTVIALINNTTGTLLSCAWKTRACRMGFMADYGINLVYVDKSKTNPKAKAEPSKMVVINTECGNFGAAGEINFLRTGWDKELDNESLAPGSQVFEKMVSTGYLSDLVRRVLVTAVQRNIILKGKMTPLLATIDALPHKIIFEMNVDSVGQREARLAFSYVGYSTPCAQDCVDLEYVCSTVITRATQLMAAAFAGVLNHIRQKEVVVGMDGNFLRWRPGAPDLIKRKVMELIPQTQFSYVLADDQGGLGTALAVCLNSGTPADDTEIGKDDSFFDTQSFMSDETKASKIAKGGCLEDSKTRKTSDVGEVVKKRVSLKHSKSSSVLREINEAQKKGTRTSSNTGTSVLDVRESSSYSAVLTSRKTSSIDARKSITSINPSEASTLSLKAVIPETSSQAKMTKSKQTPAHSPAMVRMSEVSESSPFPSVTTKNVDDMKTYNADQANTHRESQSIQSNRQSINTHQSKQRQSTTRKTADPKTSLIQETVISRSQKGSRTSTRNPSMLNKSSATELYLKADESLTSASKVRKTISQSLPNIMALSKQDPSKQRQSMSKPAETNLPGNEEQPIQRQSIAKKQLQTMQSVNQNVNLQGVSRTNGNEHLKPNRLKIPDRSSHAPISPAKEEKISTSKDLPGNEEQPKQRQSIAKKHQHLKK